MRSPSADDLNCGLRRTGLDTWSTRSILLCLALVVGGSYATAIPAGFVWLDHTEIEAGGYRVLTKQDTRRIWTQPLDTYLERREGSSVTHGGYWRPLYALSLSLDWHLWQNEAWLYHFENIGWHLAVVCGLFYLGQRLLSHVRQNREISFWAALLFAAWPLGVHSVTWVSGRKDLMCAAFSLCCLLAFNRAALQPACRSRLLSRLLWSLASGVMLAAALMCKELAFAVVLFAVAWLAFEHRRSAGQPHLTVTPLSWSSLLPMLSAAGAVLHWRFQVVGGVGLGGEYPATTLLANVALSAKLVGAYVLRVFLPTEPRIVDRWPISAAANWEDTAAVAGLLVAVTALAMGYLRRWHTWPAVCWFAIWLLPATGLLPLRHIYAERYLYPAAWGLLLWAVAIVYRELAGETQSIRAIRGGMLLGAVCCFGWCTARENLWWWGDERLFSRAVTQDPEYVEGLMALASLRLQAGDATACEELSRRAWDSLQEDGYTSYHSPFLLHTNWGLALHRLGRLDEAEEQLRLAFRCRPNNALAHYHLGLVSLTRHDYSRAEESLERALALKPGDFLMLSNLGYVKLMLGHVAQTVTILEPLVDRESDDAQNRTNLGTAHLLLGNPEQAEAQFAWLVARDPDSAVDRAKLAWAQLLQGKETEAGQHVLEAARIAPHHPTVRRVAGMMMESLNKSAAR